MLFPVTIFLAALLLFLIEPMAGKRLLPLFGGSGAVWTTSMLFFQTTLLAGYLYAHVGPKLFGMRGHAILHLFLLAGSLLALPPAFKRLPGLAHHPTLSLLLMLVLGLGAPFFLLSTLSPLLQKWRSRSGGGDVYRLYAASNLGSATSVVAYPFVVEPLVGLGFQSTLWSYGYALLLPLLALALVRSWPLDAREGEGGSEPLDWKSRIEWTLLAACPSSLLLGTTSYLSSNVAPLPLLWMAPLLLYLVTFVIAFGERNTRWREAVRPLFDPLMSAGVLASLIAAGGPLRFQLPFHLLLFFTASLVCHSALADRRPGPSRLTEFYLWLAFGGALGALFNSILAPRLFQSFLEYPLALAATVLCLRTREIRGGARERAVDLTLFLMAAGALSLGVWLLTVVGGERTSAFSPIFLGFATMAAYAARQKPLRHALLLGAVIIAGKGYEGGFGVTEWSARNFYGVLRVVTSTDGEYRLLVHGTTLHGQERIRDRGACKPLSYYHPTGPAGDLFRARPRGDGALVGLGAGSLLCYASPGERWDGFEINPAVVEAAERDFTFLRSRGDVETRIIVDDGRLALERTRDRTYSALIVDAFSSDAIPFHLLSLEAFELYRSKLRSDGILGLHISNNFLDLRQVTARVARAAGFSTLLREDLSLSAEREEEGKSASVWIAAGSEEALAPLLESGQWKRHDPEPGRPWTDAFANIYEVLR